MGRCPDDTVTSSGSAIRNPSTKPSSVPLSQDVLVQDPPKGLPELPNAVGIDEGVHNRVSMREDDGNVHHPDVWAFTALTKVVETIDDMQRKPAQSK